MPASVGLFDSFDNLDQIPLELIACWLKPVPQLIALENYLANKILYPQTLPQTAYDMQINLAILRAVLKNNSPKTSQPTNAMLGDNPFLNTTMRKLLIPGKFLPFVPNLTCLAQVFIDALILTRKKTDWFQDLWTIVITDDSDEVVGSVIVPQFNKDGVMEINSLGKNYQVKQGSSILIPCARDRCEITYRLNNGKVLGKSENAVEVTGGRLGIIVDGRSVEPT